MLCEPCAKCTNATTSAYTAGDCCALDCKEIMLISQLFSVTTKSFTKSDRNMLDRNITNVDEYI